MPKKSKLNLKQRLLKSLLLISLLFLGFIAIFLLSIKFGVFGKLPNKEQLKSIQNPQATEILADDGASLGFLYNSFRSDVEFNQLPQHLIDALVATEDVRFYQHSGVDYRSLLRVIIKTILMQDRSAGGGSTLTQQLVKNLFPRDYHNYLQLLVIKIKEAMIAQRLESIYSKNEIILLYLNTVSFSDNTFGIGAATQTFFNKETKNLNLSESAILVGSLKATYTYNPRIFPENSLTRRNLVLAQMLKYEMFELPVYEEAVAQPIKLDYSPMKSDVGIAAYFREQVRKQLSQWAEDYAEKTGKAIDIYSDGLKIHTTLNQNMQQYAESAMKTHMRNLQKAFEQNWGNLAPWKKKMVYEQYIKRTHHYQALKIAGKTEIEIQKILAEKKEMQVFDWSGSEVKIMSVIDSIQYALKTLQAGFVAMEPKTGAVKSWIGGIDFEYFKYDHVSQSKRQVGSTFKPFVYMAALENGVKACDYFSASAVTYNNLEGWKPTNSDDKDYTYINVNMQEALRKSMNTVSVRILEEAGIAAVLKLSEAVGITSEIPKVASLALGTAELSLLELATAYSSFLNNGRSATPFLIYKITDKLGNVLTEFEASEEKAAAFSQVNNQIMLEMMQNVVNTGTASRLRWRYKLSNQIAGKTGTTQNNRDGWFVGLLPNLVTISWVGADNGSIGFRATSIGQGANSALPIFGLWMQQVNKDGSLNAYSQAKFPNPSEKVIRLMDCPPLKEDGFFKKLFSNPDKEKSKNFDEDSKEKNGIFNRIKKIFN